MKEILLNKAAENARIVFSQQKVALFIVAYNAENQIEKTIRRIPEWCRPLFVEIFVIDDSSTDRTVARAIETGRSLGLKNFSVMKTPTNQGYGGNQKIGYSYAIQQGYDIVILLHGDGQYAPEYLPDIVGGYADSTVGAVFGSRMINRADALRGGMPIYKWIGNQVLTSIENTILGTHLSEFHSGYRSYRVDILKRVPFQLNSDGFHFDTDIIIQTNLLGCRILEIPMFTHYGDEECHVDGMKYAWNCIKSSVKSRLHQAGIFFQPNYEFPGSSSLNYSLKIASTSLHAFILRLPWKTTDTIADLGANQGALSSRIAKHKAQVTAVDTNIPSVVPGVRVLQADLNEPFDTLLGEQSFNKVLALDVIEHLYAPERSTREIFRILKPEGILYASTANIGYIIMRLTHLLGWFNYGKKGILDLTHHRLFTIRSFRRLLENAGFRIVNIKGFGPPILDAFGDTSFWRVIDRVSAFLANTYPPLFAFNFLIIARKTPTTEEKMFNTLTSKQS